MEAALLCVTSDQVRFAHIKSTHSRFTVSTHTDTSDLSARDAMRLMDGSRERKDGQLNLICLNADELRGGAALHQCITTTAANACIKVNQLPIDKILRFA